MKELTISLTGGLGNQLFQYAALLELGCEKKRQLTEDFGKPRQGKNGLAEIRSFRLDASQVEFKRNWLSEKFAGYLLRLGVHRKWWEIRPLMRFFATLVGSVYLTLVNRRYVGIQGYSALGHKDNFKVAASTNLLVGYFQNFHGPSHEKVKQRLMAIELLEESSKVKELKIISEVEKPLVVHVRLGDYRKEDDFGILPRAYYEKAITKHLSLGICEKIWLFSDEPHAAQDLIPESLRSKIRVIDGFSPAESLELMRMGYGYVIANSTFSWWGAFLSHREGATVIAPHKWFKNMEDPKNLLPSEWLREKTW